MKNYMKKLKKKDWIKMIIIASIGLVLLLTGILSWTFYFSKYQQFNKQEKEFLEAVTRFYSLNQQYLPKKGETREMTLQDLYDGEHISDLYVPRTRKLCDSNSWVRVYQNESGEYEYNVYLKCGKLESKGDHTGPEITLNGEENMVISLGSQYQEPGISKVYDKEDGTLDPNSVTIDSSSLNTNKVGTYNITYTVRDKSYNKTVVTRKVTIAQNLTEVVRSHTDESNYYKGLDVDNYLLFSGMLWQIVNVNADGSVKIVSYDDISNITYGQLEEDYDKSNIRDWLNNYFYKALNNPDQYIVSDSNWCLDYADNENAIINTCTNTIQDKVGLLTISDWNQSKQNNTTYLNTIGSYWLLTRQNEHYVYTHSMTSGGIYTMRSTSNLGVKPVVNLKSNLYIVSGNGTNDNPYKLDDYSYGQTNNKIKDRLIGEYVNYSGMLFRISGFDDDKNIKLISADFLGNATTQKYFYTSYQNEDKIMKFNPSQKGNIGYQLNDQYIDYIDDKLIVSHEYSIYEYDENINYSQYKINSTFKSKLSIPTSFELFSGTNEKMNAQVNYWLLDYVDEKNALMINNANGISFNITEGFYDSNAFKLVFYLKNTATISRGTGTYWDPYLVK